MGNNGSSSESLIALQKDYSPDDELTLSMVEEMVDDLRLKENLQKKVPVHFIHGIFAKIDAEGNGYITFSQFVSAVRSLQEKRQQKRQTMFTSRSLARSSRSGTPPPEERAPSPRCTAEDAQLPPSRQIVPPRSPRQTPTEHHESAVSPRRVGESILSPDVGRPISQPKSPRHSAIHRGSMCPSPSPSPNSESAASPRSPRHVIQNSVSQAPRGVAQLRPRTSEVAPSPREQASIQAKSPRNENRSETAQTRKKVASTQEQNILQNVSAPKRSATQRNSAMQDELPSQALQNSARSPRTREAPASSPMTPTTPLTPRTMAELCAEANRGAELASKAAPNSDDRGLRSRPQKRVSTWPARSSGDSHSPVKLSGETDKSQFGKSESLPSRSRATAKVVSAQPRIAKREASNDSTTSDDSNSARVVPKAKAVGSTSRMDMNAVEPSPKRKAAGNPMLVKSASSPIGTVEKKHPSRKRAAQPKNSTPVSPAPAANSRKNSSQSSESDSAPAVSPRPSPKKKSSTTRLEASSRPNDLHIDSSSPRVQQAQLEKEDRSDENKSQTVKQGRGLLAAMRKVEADYGPRRKSEIVEGSFVSDDAREKQVQKRTTQQAGQHRDVLNDPMQEQGQDFQLNAINEEDEAQHREPSKRDEHSKLRERPQAVQQTQKRRSQQAPISSPQGDSLSVPAIMDSTARSPRDETPRRKPLRTAARINTMVMDYEEQRKGAQQAIHDILHDSGDKLQEHVVAPTENESASASLVSDRPTTPRRKPLRVAERARRSLTTQDQRPNSAAAPESSQTALQTSALQIEAQQTTQPRASTSQPSGAPDLRLEIQRSPQSCDSNLNSISTPSPHPQSQPSSKTFDSDVASANLQIERSQSPDSDSHRLSILNPDPNVENHPFAQRRDSKQHSPRIISTIQERSIQQSFSPGVPGEAGPSRAAPSVAPRRQSGLSPRIARHDSSGSDRNGGTSSGPKHAERRPSNSAVEHNASSKLQSVAKEEASNSSDESISGIMALSRRPSARGFGSNEQPTDLWKPLGAQGEVAPSTDRRSSGNLESSKVDQKRDGHLDDEYSRGERMSKRASNMPRGSIQDHLVVPRASDGRRDDDSDEGYDYGQHAVRESANVPRTSILGQLAVPRAASQPARSSQSSTVPQADKRQEKKQKESDQANRRKSKAFLGSAGKEPKQDDESYQSWLFKNVFS